MRFSAAANHSSEKERTFEPRGAEMRSVVAVSTRYTEIIEQWYIPMYFDLKVESISSAGMLRGAAMVSKVQGVTRANG